MCAHACVSMRVCVCVHGVLYRQHVSVFVYVCVRGRLCALDPDRMVENHGTLLFPALYEFHD